MKHHSRQPRSAFSRRYFLRGLGACISLPAFESLSSFRLLAGASPDAPATTAAGAPLRAAFLYFPNGAIPAAWWPASAGPDPELKGTLEPLEPCRKQIQILGGLDDQSANPGNDGAGDHARANGTFLTGVRVNKSATDIRAGVSIDQVLAGHVGSLTRFPSLELTCETNRASGACDSGYSCAYQFNLAWSSPTTPVAAEANPRLVFERLFGAGSPDQRAESLRRRRVEQRSILDFITEDARQMQHRLDASDRAKLDQYLTGVRELETRLQKVEALGDGRHPQVPAPAGIPTNYAEHIQLMFDLLVLAFETDSTRVATFLMAHDGSNRSFVDIGVPEGHHDLSHHANEAEKVQKVAAIDRWYASQFAQFLQKLEAVKDADGQSLLHNSMIVYGGGNADGNRHTHVNLPIILAGAGGGTFTPGRYVQHGAKPLTNLFLSMAERMGLPRLDRFGDSTAPLGNV